MAKSNLALVTEELAPFLVTAAPVDAAAYEAERLTIDALRNLVADVVAKKFGGRYLLASDIGDLQTAVRAACKKRFQKAVVTLTPSRGGGFSIEVDGI